MEMNARSERMLEAIRCFLNGKKAEWQEDIRGGVDGAFRIEPAAPGASDGI